LFAWNNSAVLKFNFTTSPIVEFGKMFMISIVYFQQQRYKKIYIKRHLCLFILFLLLVYWTKDKEHNQAVVLKEIFTFNQEQKSVNKKNLVHRKKYNFEFDDDQKIIRDEDEENRILHYWKTLDFIAIFVSFWLDKLVYMIWLINLE